MDSAQKKAKQSDTIKRNNDVFISSRSGTEITRGRALRIELLISFAFSRFKEGGLFSREFGKNIQRISSKCSFVNDVRLEKSERIFVSRERIC